MLADLGLCLSIDDATGRVTDTPEAIGSRLYTAPENESGINEDQDQRPADLYAFGKIVWALLAGRSPFSREAYREPSWRLSRITGEPRLDRLDSFFDLTLAADVRVRARAKWDEVIAELLAVEATFGSPHGEPMTASAAAIEMARAYANRHDVVERRVAFQDFNTAAHWLQSELIPAYRDGLRTIEASLAELQTASNGEIVFWISDEWLGMELTSYFPEFLPHGGVPTPRDFVKGGHYLGADNSGGAPRLVMPSWFRTTAESAVVASIPVVYWATEIELPQRPLLQYAETLGPLPPNRAASVKAVIDFATRRAQLFLKLAVRYVEMVVGDKEMIFVGQSEWDLGEKA